LHPGVFDQPEKKGLSTDYQESTKLFYKLRLSFVTRPKNLQCQRMISSVGVSARRSLRPFITGKGDRT
jgi:hypothetical protein